MEECWKWVFWLLSGVKVILHDALKIQVRVTFKISPVFLWEAFKKSKIFEHAILSLEPRKKTIKNYITEALGTR